MHGEYELHIHFDHFDDKLNCNVQVLATTTYNCALPNENPQMQPQKNNNSHAESK